MQDPETQIAIQEHPLEMYGYPRQISDTIPMRKSIMKKSATVSVRVDPEIKREAEEVLNVLGLSMTTAVEVYLKQIVLRKEIPFNLEIPKMPKEFDLSQLSEEEFLAKIQKGLDQAKDKSKLVPLDEALQQIRENFDKDD